MLAEAVHNEVSGRVKVWVHLGGVVNVLSKQAAIVLEKDLHEAINRANELEFDLKNEETGIL